MKKIQSLKSPIFAKFDNSKVEFFSKILGGADPNYGDATVWTGGERDVMTAKDGSEVKVYN